MRPVLLMVAVITDHAVPSEPVSLRQSHDLPAAHQIVLRGILQKNVCRLCT